MKKGSFLIGIVLILVINLVSASYNCDDGSLILEDQDEIGVGGRKAVNGLGLGVTYSDETAALNRFSAELIVDAGKLTLTNEEPSLDVELISGTHNITLFNLTDDDAVIHIDGDSKSISVGEVVEENSLEIFLFSVQGTYPGEASIEVIVGESKVSLSSDGNPDEIITVKGVEYLLELFSASDDNAIVKVKKCESGKIIEVEDEIVDPDENLTIDDENLTIENSTDINQTDLGDNQTLEPEDNNTEDNQTDNGNKSLDDSETMPFFNSTSLIIIVIVIIVIAILVMYFRKKSKKK